jgi:hypothetical protein
MADDLFDFGFTLVDENELEAVQKAQETVSSVTASTSETQEKLDAVFNAVQPLLNNLKKNPEKEYILWPNRLEKIEQFEDHIQKLYKGS